MATRPTSIAEMMKHFEHFETEEGVRRGLAYKPSPTDIFITPYAKCGTTWMQQIVHGLRTGGSMDFREITEVVPWLDLAHDMGMDVNAPQVAHPRAFKSHLAWDKIPKGGRYIVVFRDPVDAMVSMYRFFEGWSFEPGSISVPEFADFYLARSGDSGYWNHAASWWRQRDRPEVLLFCFEHMKRDLEGTVNRVADFMGILPTSAARRIATRQASFEFMKRHDRQFDDHLIREARDPACGFPPGGHTSKVKQGKAGTGALEVSPEIRARFAERWHDTMTREFGLETYEDLARAVAARA